MNTCHSLPGLLSAIILTAPSPPVLAGFEVLVRTVEHQPISGDLVRFSLEGGLLLTTIADGQEISLPANDVVRILSRSAQSTERRPFCLVLHGGDRLYGTISGSAVDQIIVDTVMREHIAIPISQIQACLTVDAKQQHWDKKIAQLIDSTTDQDQVLLANGDVMQGFVSHIAPEKITFEQLNRQIEVDFDVVVAIAMSTEGHRQSDDLRARLQFIDGSTLTVSRLSWTPEAVDLTFFDGTLQGLSPTTIHSVEIRGARWVWLGEISPVEFDHTPLLSLRWPLRVDQNVVGGPLVLAGTNYAHGLGVHSKAHIQFELAGAFQTFVATCGLDVSAGPLANVTAAVLVDGEVKWHQAHITRSSGPYEIRVDLSGAESLELQVDYGTHGDLQDRFDWADAALIR